MDNKCKCGGVYQRKLTKNHEKDGQILNQNLEFECDICSSNVLVDLSSYYQLAAHLIVEIQHVVNSLYINEKGIVAVELRELFNQIEVPFPTAG